MDKRSAGLKDYFVVRRRIKTSEEDGKKKKTTGESPKRILSPAKAGQLSAFRSPVRLSSKTRTGLSASSPSKRVRETGSVSAADGVPKLERFDFIEFDSPTKKEKRSPSSAGGTGTDLPLPKSYQYLAEQFRCTDVIVDMLRRRQETCTFNKLKKAVEEMSGKAFTMTTVAQMKTAYPRALTHYYDTNIPGDHDNRSKHQLVVEANMEERALDFSSTPGKMTHFNSSSFIHRRRVFHRNLLSLVRHHHRAFLASLEPPLEIADRDVFHWHQDFDLDSVPEVEEASLPAPPVTETFPSAKQLLLKHVMSPRIKHTPEKRGVQNTPERDGVDSTPEKGVPATPKKGVPVSPKKGVPTTPKKGVPATPKKGVPVTPRKGAQEGSDERESTPKKTGVDSNDMVSASVAAGVRTTPLTTPEKRSLSKDSSHLQGVPRKLIEKIQEKEAARARLEIMRGPGETKELSMLDTSMKMVPILKSYFLLEKKAAVPLYDVVAKVQESYTSHLSQDFVEETLDYLVRSGVSWIQIVTIKSRRYVKVDRSADVNLVLKKIMELKKQHFKVTT